MTRSLITFSFSSIGVRVYCILIPFANLAEDVVLQHSSISNQLVMTNKPVDPPPAELWRPTPGTTPTTGNLTNVLLSATSNSGGINKSRDSKPDQPDSLFHARATGGFKHRGSAPDLGTAHYLSACKKRTEGQYSVAEKTFQAALNLRKIKLGADHIRVAETLFSLADMYIEQQRYAEAVPLLNKSLAITEKIYGTNSVDVSINLDALGYAFYRQALFTEAEGVHRRALAIRKEAIRTLHTNRNQSSKSTARAKVALSLNGLARALTALGRREETSPLIGESSSISRDPQVPEPFDIGHGWSKAAREYELEGNFKRAEELFWDAMLDRENFFTPDHAYLGQSIENLSRVMREQGRYAEAERLGKRAVIHAEINCGLDHPRTADTLKILADLYVTQGRYGEAATLYERAYNIEKLVWTTQMLSTGVTANRLAEVLCNHGDFTTAENYLRSALKTFQRVYPPEHPLVCMVKVNIAGAKLAQGYHEEAERLIHESLEGFPVQDRIDDVDAHFPRSPFLDMSYLKNIQVFQPTPLLRWALDVLSAETIFDKTVIKRLANSKNLAQKLEIVEAVSELHRRALSVIQKRMGEQHPAYASALGVAALWEEAFGHRTGALEYYRRAETILEGAVGLDHPDVGAVSGEIAILCFSSDKASALTYARKAAHAEQAVRSEGFAMMSERQRIAFAGFRGDVPLRVAASLALYDGNSLPEATEAAWLMHLRNKGAVLDSMLEERQNLSGSPEAEAVFARLNQVRRQLSNLQFSDFSRWSDGAEKSYQRQIQDLRVEQDELEQRLARLSSRFHKGLRTQKITPDDVASALPKNTVLVDFLRFTPLSSATETNEHFRSEGGRIPLYVAFVLNSGSRLPQFIPIGKADDIDRLIGTCRAHMQSGEPSIDELKALYRLVWAPLHGQAGAGKRVLISPDGELSQLPFAALLDTDGRYLAECHEIGYLSSGRDLICQQKSVETSPPSLFGSPSFYINSNVTAEVASVPNFTMRAAFRSVLSKRDHVQYEGLRLPLLPGTREEVERLGSLLSGKSPRIFLGADATEGEFKRLQRPQLLHLATHGFYLADSESKPAAQADRSDGSKRSPGVLRGNPMHRSGLALSGAASTLAGVPPVDRDDGIVTAEEVAGLDLWGTRLVVLSACDTGRGQSLSGEGVLGLRRAFIQAGAQNLMLTLWRIEDHFTRDLMVAFYTDYLKTDDAVGALTRVQRNLLRNSDPRFWAPFVISVQGYNPQGPIT